jgi:hypothetical protein
MAAFSSPPEVCTFEAFAGVLAPLGYSISQKVRAIDCVRAAAENPRTTTPVGSALADVLLPALRQQAGPFGPAHPWLQASDWGYAFRAHFDFVVHDRLRSSYPTHPLFAVEFDGRRTHASEDARRRDHAKHRLCAASGLPLARINDTFLHRRERLSLVEWLATLWAAHRSEMPRLLAERDAEVETMTEEERAAAGPWLLMERPDLDVDLLFRLKHPFPPTQILAERLARRYRFYWTTLTHQVVERPRWKVTRWRSAVPVSNGGLVERWQCEVTLTGPHGHTAELRGIADVQQGYPLHEGPVLDSWEALLAKRLPYLPAGPWTTAPSVLGEALCVHNTLLRVEQYLRRNDRE